MPRVLSKGRLIKRSRGAKIRLACLLASVVLNVALTTSLRVYFLLTECSLKDRKGGMPYGRLSIFCGGIGRLRLRSKPYSLAAKLPRLLTRPGADVHLLITCNNSKWKRTLPTYNAPKRQRESWPDTLRGFPPGFSFRRHLTALTGICIKTYQPACIGGAVKHAIRASPGSGLRVG